MQIFNISNPGQAPIEGDWIEIHRDGSIEGKTYHEPIIATLTLDDAKAEKIALLRSHFESVVASVKADAAPYEVATWETQRTEYMAWQANNATPTPYVSGLATARGLTVPELMAKIAAKVAAFATLQGTQHALETSINTATTIKEVEDIIW